MTRPAISIIAECRRRGFQLRVKDGLLQFRPRDAMPADLKTRLSEHKSEILAALAVRSADPAGIPTSRSPESDAARPEVSQGGGKRPEDNGKPSPIKWTLDELDRRVLLDLGIMPTPDLADLPPAWQRHYENLRRRLVKIGVYLEHAEHQALRDTLKRMLACGELLPEGW
jgi:hypothetical protein